MFNTKPLKNMYAAEAADGIEPVDSLGQSILRYTENNVSAGIAYRDSSRSVIVFGFPFETILQQENRDLVMHQVLRYFEEPTPPVLPEENEIQWEINGNINEGIKEPEEN